MRILLFSLISSYVSSLSLSSITLQVSQTHTNFSVYRDFNVYRVCLTVENLRENEVRSGVRYDGRTFHLTQRRRCCGRRRRRPVQSVLASDPRRQCTIMHRAGVHWPAFAGCTCNTRDDAIIIIIIMQA